MKKTAMNPPMPGSFRYQYAPNLTIRRRSHPRVWIHAATQPGSVGRSAGAGFIAVLFLQLMMRGGRRKSMADDGWLLSFREVKRILAAKLARIASAVAVTICGFRNPAQPPPRAVVRDALIEQVPVQAAVL